MNDDHKQLISNLFNQIGFENAELNIDQDPEQGHINIDIQVPKNEAGLLIGYQGEKIDSIRLVLSLMINNNQEKYIPIQLNVNDYRQQRDQFLFNLADEAAAKAVESQKEILLPPLSSFERRQVHMHLSENEQVTTYSEGEGKSRRLVVQPKQ